MSRKEFHISIEHRPEASIASIFNEEGSVIYRSAAEFIPREKWTIITGPSGEEIARYKERLLTLRNTTDIIMRDGTEFSISGGMKLIGGTQRLENLGWTLKGDVSSFRFTMEDGDKVMAEVNRTEDPAYRNFTLTIFDEEYSERAAVIFIVLHDILRNPTGGAVSSTNIIHRNPQ